MNKFLKQCEKASLSSTGLILVRLSRMQHSLLTVVGLIFLLRRVWTTSYEFDGYIMQSKPVRPLA